MQLTLEVQAPKNRLLVTSNTSNKVNGSISWGFLRTSLILYSIRGNLRFLRSKQQEFPELLLGERHDFRTSTSHLIEINAEFDEFFAKLRSGLRISADSNTD